ncbi:MAG: hypothetical protein AAGF74_02410 [Pseudomonadota bacterium]
MSSEPKLSMMLVTKDSYETSRRTIGCLLEQTVLGDIELVIVCPSREGLDPEMDEIEQFGCYQIVETGAAYSSGQMVAAGIVAARAPGVMYLEEHNFPPPRVAEVAIRELVDNGRPAIGFPMVPANPGLVAWSHLFGQFATAVAPVKAGPVDRIGGHHAAYRKDALAPYQNNLTHVMDNEAVMHEDFRRRGVPMYMTEDVVIPHTQVSDFREYCRHEYLAQRIFGAARAKVLDWSLARRLIYAAGFPLIPFVRMGRSVWHIRRTGRTRELLPQILPVMLAANTCGAFGEALGYIFGDTEAMNADRMELELDRYAFVREEDRRKAREAGLTT